MGIDYNQAGQPATQLPFDSLQAALYTGIGADPRFTLFFNNKHPGDYTGELGYFAPAYGRPTMSWINSNQSYYGYQNSPNTDTQYYPMVLESTVTIVNNSAEDWPAVTGWGMLRDNWNPTTIAEGQRNLTLAKNLIMFRPIPVAEQQPLRIGESFSLVGQGDPVIVDASDFVKVAFIRLKIEALIS